MSSDDQLVLFEIEKHIATVTINRPEKRNALNMDTRRELAAVIQRIERADNVRVVVLRGAGKSFISGGDIDKFSEMDLIDSIRYLRNHASGLYDAIAEIPCPVIAGIDGHALGGGLEIALACDIRIATDSSKFGLPEVSLGIMPAAGGTQRLPAVVGLGIAKELILTGRIIDSTEAQEIGLVNRVVSPDQLDAAISEVCENLVGNAPLAVQFAKEATNRSAIDPLGLAFERAAGSVLFGTNDKHEGVTAFLEDRDPEFTGG